MNFPRALIALDIESTGLDACRDRIIEIGLIFRSPSGKTGRFEHRFNPGIPISPEAAAVHGITDEMVALKPPFSEFAARILKTLEGKDIVGFNLRRLDLPMLDEELRRCGLKLDLTGVRIIDAAGIFFKANPRTLEAAVLKYCGRVHEGAHGAGDDAAATLAVLDGQMKEHPDLDAMTVDDLAAYSNLSDVAYVDLAGKLYRDAEGDLRYAFGKNRDVKVRDDYGYFKWMMAADFSGSTKDALREEAERLRGLLPK